MDLTKRPPRSPRVRLGGFCILPRILDKCRATLAGTNGEYKYACPLDMNFLNLLGISPDGLKDQVKMGKGDGEIMEWILRTTQKQMTIPEIMAWSAYHDQRAPADLETRQFFNDYHAQTAPHREDVTSWFDMLDLDDYVTFGGKA